MIIYTGDEDVGQYKKSTYKELDKRFSIVNSNKITKKARIEATVLIPISKSEICKILPDVSVTTVETVLGSMVKKGSIIIIGSGRNTKYMRNNNGKIFTN